ncbi:hypothetical protein PhCBS80983_g00006 [Powellomyces hirtus]|uniref:Phosphodiesterase n=1 Tax=Powellomyces hirtus TaxID=109895 RepID=A0A507EF80_9FUNG|nr:hypothetical protein PhCBS80983_g00006 [Powellomyces hirtus]
MATSYPVYLSINGGGGTPPLHETVQISPDLSLDEVRSVLYAAAGLAETSKNADTDRVLRLSRADGVLLPAGPHIPKNTPETRYNLEIKQHASNSSSLDAAGLGDALDVVTALLDKVTGLKAKVAEAQQAEEQQKKGSDAPASRRVRLPPVSLEKPAKVAFDPAVTEQLKHPTFDIWQWQEPAMADLLAHMFTEFDLLKLYNIEEDTLRRFLECVRASYNSNPFHNFRHCFCVTQMMYGLLHVTNVHEKLTPLEKLTLLIACIGHDLDHPGFNNAYQVNASTELSLVYNDISPLENHHAAVLFTILKSDETNVLKTLSDADYKECRKQIIACILATDMAKHGEIMGRFKGFVEAGFNFDDAAQRSVLLQMITKCADISNEVRPKHVSEPWVDNLLEEFFTQSDREKAEGLPFAPFMDREKVTKSGAQVGFIGFVMIPLFELVGKVLPNMEEHVIAPIRKALEYYKGLSA